MEGVTGSLVYLVKSTAVAICLFALCLGFAIWVMLWSWPSARGPARLPWFGGRTMRKSRGLRIKHRKTSRAKIARQWRKEFRKVVGKITWVCDRDVGYGGGICGRVNTGWRFSCHKCGKPPPPEIRERYRQIAYQYNVHDWVSGWGTRMPRTTCKVLKVFNILQGGSARHFCI